MTARQHIQIRRDTSANWAAVNPILKDGEPGYEADVRRLKVGNGTTPWSGLQYLTSSNAVRIDSSTLGVLYVGKASAGSSESASAWTITRSTFSAAGVRISKGTATGVSWSGRTSHTYA